jgi:hypothetical protein
VKTDASPDRQCGGAPRDLRDAVAAASDAKREAALRKMQRQGVEVADSAAVLGSAPS